MLFSILLRQRLLSFSHYNSTYTASSQWSVSSLFFFVLCLNEWPFQTCTINNGRLNVNFELKSILTKPKKTPKGGTYNNSSLFCLYGNCTPASFCLRSKRQVSIILMRRIRELVHYNSEMASTAAVLILARCALMTYILFQYFLLQKEE